MLLKPLRSGVEFLRSVHDQSRALQWFGLPALSSFSGFTSCRPMYLVHRLEDQQFSSGVPCHGRRFFFPLLAPLGSVGSLLRVRNARLSTTRNDAFVQAASVRRVRDVYLCHFRFDVMRMVWVRMVCTVRSHRLFRRRLFFSFFSTCLLVRSYVGWFLLVFLGSCFVRRVWAGVLSFEHGVRSTRFGSRTTVVTHG